MPGFALRNGHVQTILASLKIRAMGKNPLRGRSEKILVDAGSGIRLLGYRTLQPKGRSLGLVILIHGWEGSSDSTYMLTTGSRLYRGGYDIFRLNLRDHGESHDLNEGVFHSGRIEEVFSAVLNIAASAGGKPCHLVGFSLGGNFGIRVALRLNPAAGRNPPEHHRHQPRPGPGEGNPCHRRGVLRLPRILREEVETFA